MDPALGLSGALAALGNRSSDQGGDLSSAARDLSSAARGLQSVQGNVAGQTMAIQQMSMSGAQQVQSMNMLMMQLNMSIGQLTGAMAQMSATMRMQGFQSVAQASAPSPMPYLPPSSGGGNFFGGMAQGAGDVLGLAGRGIMGVGRAGIGALGAGARAIGGVYGAAASPFFGASYNGPEAGTQFGSIGNAGMMRSLMLGSGIGAMLQKPGFQQVQGGEMMRMGADRGAFKFGEIGLGAFGGLANFGASMVGGQMGSMVGGALGGSALGGVGRFAGSLAGGVAGMGLGSLIAAPINQTLDQVGNIRAGGELFGRNAFRFLSGEASRGATGMPSFRERGRFGSAMQSEGTDDLTFDQQDMQRIFGGMIGNDLTRGVGNAQQVRQRLRQTKENIKVIGQTMAMTIEESAGLLGDLQAAGVDPSRAGRVVSGFNVTGLTRREAMGGQMAFAGQFAGTGLQGSGLMRLGAQSQQLAQTSIRSGALNSEQLAAVGGRAGAQSVMGNAMAGLLGGDFGTMMMFAGMPGGGVGSVRGGALSVMGQAGGAVTPERMAAFAANPQKFMREAMKDPRLMSQMFAQVSSAASTISRGTGVSQRDAMALVLQGQGRSAVEADAILSMLEKSPEAMRDQSFQMQSGLNDLVTSQRSENFSLVGRANRAVQRFTRPAAQHLASAVAGAQDTVVNMTSDVRDRVLGIEHVNIQSRDVNMATMRNLSSGPITAKRKGVVGSVVDPKTQKGADNIVRYTAASLGGADSMEEVVAIRASTDPEEKKALAEKLVNKLSAFRYNKASPEEKKALELAASREAGVDISSILNSGASAGLTKSEKQQMADAKADMNDVLGGGSGAAGASVGSAAGAIIGFLTPVLGGAAAGAAIGAAWGGSKGALSGMSDEQITTLARNPNFQKLIKAQSAKQATWEKAEADFKSGKITKTEMLRRQKVAVDQLATAGADAMKADEIPADVKRELLGMNTEKLAKFKAGMDTFEKFGGREGSSLALTAGFATAKGAAAAAGLSELAGSLGAGSGGMSAAMKQLSGLSEADRIALAGQGAAGAALLTARQLHKGMTSEQVKNQLGEGVAALMGDTKSLNTDEDVTALQQAIIAQTGGAPGTRATGAGFTDDQMKQQAEIAARLADVSTNMVELAKVVKSMKGS